MKKTFKKENAITLIALVITIIILLILAGITVATLSNSELFEKADVAKEKYKNSAKLEDERIKMYSNGIEDYINNGREYTPLDYSGTEQLTGQKWMDGKPIYQKTIVATVGSSAKTNHEINDLDSIVDVSGIANGGDKRVIPFAFYGDPKWYCGLTVTSSFIWIEAGTDFCSAHSKAFVTLQYTKTTD